MATTAAQEAQEAGERKLSDEQRREAQALVDVVNRAMQGEPAASDLELGWQNDFLKAQEGRTYVPFTISFDATQVAKPSVAMFLRVAARQASAAPAEDNPDRQEKETEPEYAFEDVHFVPLSGAVNGRHRISRAFAVPAGDYDVYVAIKEDTGGKEDAEQPAKVSLLKQPVTVPEFWTGDLTTSSVILAERVEPAAALSQEEQAQHPYTLGTTRIVPKPDANYDKADELSIVFLIYNPALKDNKPDVSVEYNFHQRTAEGEKYFNKTNPQQFNAQTLPPQFDMAAGHQLVAGQSIPLTTFPEGDYRLEIKVTDNASGKSVAKDVQFSVVAS